MDLKLAGKTALVLGGSKGLGRGVADALAGEGVAVAVVSRGKEAVDKATAEIKAQWRARHRTGWRHFQLGLDRGRREKRAAGTGPDRYSPE